MMLQKSGERNQVVMRKKKSHQAIIKRGKSRGPGAFDGFFRGFLTGKSTTLGQIFIDVRLHLKGER